MRSLFAKFDEILNCDIGNTQCGGKCQSRNNKCPSEKDAETSRQLDKFEKLILRAINRFDSMVDKALDQFEKKVGATLESKPQAPTVTATTQTKPVAAQTQSESIDITVPEVYGESIEALANLLKVKFEQQGVKVSEAQVKFKVRKLEEYQKKYAETGQNKFEQYTRAALTLMFTDDNTPRQLSSTLTGQEVKKLKNNEIKQKLLNGYKDPTQLIGGSYDNKGKFTPFKDQSGAVIKYKDAEMPEVNDDEFIKFFLDMAPDSFKNSIKRAGKPAGKAFAGYDAEGNRINKGDGSSIARQIVLTRQWIRQRNQSAYTGLPLTFANADLEHIKPLGANGNDAEDPNNYVWVSKSENQTKNEYDMSYLFDGGKAYPGVDNVEDPSAWHKNVFMAAEEKAKQGLFQKNDIKDNVLAIITAVTGDLKSKAEVINILKNLNKNGKEMERAVTLYCRDLIDKEGLKLQEPRRGVVWQNKSEGFRARNEDKYPGTVNVEMNFGNIKKSEINAKTNKPATMKLSEWMLWNFTSMPKEGQIEMIKAYEEVLQRFANHETNPNKSITLAKFIATEMPKALEAVYSKYCGEGKCMPPT